jgi:hypothetical protein
MRKWYLCCLFWWFVLWDRSRSHQCMFAFVQHSYLLVRECRHWTLWLDSSFCARAGFAPVNPHLVCLISNPWDVLLSPSLAEASIRLEIVVASHLVVMMVATVLTIVRFLGMIIVIQKGMEHSMNGEGRPRSCTNYNTKPNKWRALTFPADCADT